MYTNIERLIHIERRISRVLFSVEDWYFLRRIIWWMSIYFINILSVCSFWQQKPYMWKYFFIVEGFFIFLFYVAIYFSISVFIYIFLVILKSFATYKCRHPCLLLKVKILCNYEDVTDSLSHSLTRRFRPMTVLDVLYGFAT